MSFPTPPVVMLDIDGTHLTDEDKELLRHPLVGGLILFSRNYESREQLQQLVQAIRAERNDILLAVDHEGGRVQRFRDGFTAIPPMAALGQQYNDNPEFALDGATLLGQLMAAELLDFDIDISFAPVLDLDDDKSTIIGNRSFHQKAAAVTALAGAFIDGMQLAGMAATGKHFPGHGSVVADSHLELPTDPRSLVDIMKHDVIPFAELAHRLQGIMPAHIVYPAVDNQPAGFSHIWLQDILREQLGFQGVIFSDDLGMAGAAIAGSFAERAEAALLAGCDMVLACNDRAGAVEVIEWLEQHPVAVTQRASSLRRRYQAVTMSQRRRDAAYSYLDNLAPYVASVSNKGS